MNKKIILPFLVLTIAVPFYAAMADDVTGTASTADCGSAPSAPAVGATVQEWQQYRQELNKYNQCKKDQLKDQKKKLDQDRCDKINQKINDRLSNFQNKQNGDATIFGNIYQRLSNLATRLKNSGLDTKKLTDDLATLKTKIDKINTDYASFISSLKETENFTCGTSQGQFMGKLGAARGILLSVRQDRQNVKSYIIGTIRPDILALREQLAKREQADKSIDSPDSGEASAPNAQK